MRRMIFRKSLLTLAASTAMAMGIQIAHGQSPTVLEQLSQDTQHLYDKVHLSVVRVQLPTPQWLEQLNEQTKLLQKWRGQLNPDVVKQLQLEQEKARSAQYRNVGAVAGTQPSESPTTEAVAVPSTQTPNSGIQFPGRTPPSGAGGLVLVATGLLVNDRGYVVVPLYVDQPSIGNNPLKVLMGDGRLTTARYVGSDKFTNITVIQLENHNGQPAALSHGRPDDGSLALMISSDGSARLTVWSSQHPDPGLIVMTDGSIAGFGFNGGILTASTCKPIVDQIIAYGSVHRAVLGVRVREIRKDDVLRQSNDSLGLKPAIRVEAVDPQSAADVGGLRSGDLILAIGDEPVGETQTFAALIATRSGKTALHVLRDSTQITLTVDMQPK